MKKWIVTVMFPVVMVAAATTASACELWGCSTYGNGVPRQCLMLYAGEPSSAYAMDCVVHSWSEGGQGPVQPGNEWCEYIQPCVWWGDLKPRSRQCGAALLTAMVRRDPALQQDAAKPAVESVREGAK
jgi:hypothetical protein